MIDELRQTSNNDLKSYRLKDANIERYKRIKKIKYVGIRQTYDNFCYHKLRERGRGIYALQNKTYFISYERDDKYHLFRRCDGFSQSMKSSFYLGVVWRHFLKTF